jgi:hypothetical protein
LEWHKLEPKRIVDVFLGLRGYELAARPEAVCIELEFLRLCQLRQVVEMRFRAGGVKKRSSEMSAVGPVNFQLAARCERVRPVRQLRGFGD